MLGGIPLNLGGQKPSLGFSMSSLDNKFKLNYNLSNGWYSFLLLNAYISWVENQSDQYGTQSLGFGGFGGIVSVGSNVQHCMLLQEQTTILSGKESRESLAFLWNLQWAVFSFWLQTQCCWQKLTIVENIRSSALKKQMWWKLQTMENVWLIKFTQRLASQLCSPPWISCAPFCYFGSF